MALPRSRVSCMLYTRRCTWSRTRLTFRVVPEAGADERILPDLLAPHYASSERCDAASSTTRPTKHRRCPRDLFAKP